MRSKLLKGYSGCRIELIEDGATHYFVRKTSFSENYNSRLELQIKKQLDFQENGFLVPEVFDSGINEMNLRYFDMEYIPGLKFSDQINSSLSVKESQNLIELLERLKSTKFKSLPKDTIDLKLSSYEKFQHRGLNIIPAIEFLKGFDWTRSSLSECHGDLTFENMIINRRGIFLIDFQDVVIDSFSQDFSKLLLDLEWNWSSRFLTDESTLVRNYGNRIKLKRTLDSNLKLFEVNENSSVILAFQLFNALRMLPYIKDDQSDKLITNIFRSIAKRLQII